MCKYFLRFTASSSESKEPIGIKESVDIDLGFPIYGTPIIATSFSSLKRPAPPFAFDINTFQLSAIFLFLFIFSGEIYLITS